MTVTWDLPDEALRRLEVEAARRNVSVEALVAELAAGLPENLPTKGRRNPAFVAVGASEDGISHQIDELLADGFGLD